MSEHLIELQPIQPPSCDAPPSPQIASLFNQIFDSSPPSNIQYQFNPNPFRGYVSPFQTHTLLWDLFLIICIYTFLFEMGFLLAFTSKFWINLKSFGYSVSLYIILLLVFIIDIGVNFHKGFYKIGQGYVITDKRRIMRHYLRSYFFIDLVTLACVVLPLAEDSVWNFFQVVFVVKFLKIRSYEGEIHQGLEEYPMMSLTYSLITLFVNACLISHYLAAIFIRIDLELWKMKYYGDDPIYYWLSNNSVYPLDEMDGAWIVQYIYGQNFAMGTLSTMAPGPFPRNQIEVIYTNFVMIGLIILSSFLADGVVKIFYWEAERRVEHETNIQSFSFFLKTKEVSNVIKHKTQNYFELIWEIEGKRDKQAQQNAIEKLSKKLREELLLEIINLKYISFLGYFREGEHELKLALIEHFEESLTEGDEVLFSPQSQPPSNLKIHIVFLGMVEFSVLGPNNTRIPIGLSKQQRVLGVYEFITQQNFFYEARTIHLTNYYSIQRPKFMEVIERLNMKEKFDELKYKVEIEENLTIINKRCLVCFEKHREPNCPRLVYSAATRMDYEGRAGEVKNERIKWQRENKVSRLGSVRLRKDSESNPLAFFNNDMFKNYIREILEGDKFEECENFQEYFPEHNLQKHLSD